MKIKNAIIATTLAFVALLAGCGKDAQVASRNISTASDMFEIQRRTVFYNGFTGEYMLVVEGKCSIDHQGRQLELVCKVGRDAFKKHFLGLSNNVTYFVEQLDSADVSVYHNRIVWKPQSVIPNIDINGSAKDFKDHVINK